MTEKLTPRRLVGILLVVTASGFGVFWLVRAAQHPDTIENALWLAGPDGPVLLVHERILRNGSDESFTENRLVELDPRTGRERRSSKLEDDGRDPSITLITSRGSLYVTYRGGPWGGAYTLRGLDGSKQPLNPDDAASQYGIRPNTFAPNFGCYADQLSEPHWHFKELARDGRSRKEDGLYSDERLLLQGLRYPRFACDRVKGPVRIGSDPILLETAPVTYSLLDELGQRRWSWSPPPMQRDLRQPSDIYEAWAFEGGVILRTNRLFVSLDQHGKERWRALL